jgi:Sortase domain
VPSFRSRRARGLLGLLASAALAAGAVAVWAAWSVPTPVRLAPPAAAATPAVPATPSQSPTQSTAGTGHSVVTGATASPPVAVAIPALGVRARIVPEGIGPGGALDIPPPAEVGWYDQGPAPGQDGTTVLAGHIDDHGVAGAFLRLNDLQAGATVRVTTASGRVAAYTVTERRMLPQDDLAGSGLLSQQGAPELVMISCGGDYDEATHLYLDNIVIVATPVGVTPVGPASAGPGR